MTVMLAVAKGTIAHRRPGRSRKVLTSDFHPIGRGYFSEATTPLDPATTRVISVVAVVGDPYPPIVQDVLKAVPERDQGTPGDGVP